jgi:hypothetical protein
LKHELFLLVYVSGSKIQEREFWIKVVILAKRGSPDLTWPVTASIKKNKKLQPMLVGYCGLRTTTWASLPPEAQVGDKDLCVLYGWFCPVRH